MDDCWISWGMKRRVLFRSLVGGTEVKKALEAHRWSEGEELSSMIIPSKFADFSSFLGLPMVGFEKEITVFLRKMESRKGCGLMSQGEVGNLCLFIWRGKSESLNVR